MAGSKPFGIAAIPNGINKDALIAKMRAGQALTSAERDFAVAQYEANIRRIEDELYPDGTDAGDGRDVHHRTFINGVSVAQLCQNATANLNLSPYESNVYMRAYVATMALARDSVIEYLPAGKHNSDEPNPQVRLDTRLAEKDLELERPKKGFWRTIGEALRIVKPLPTPQEIYEQKMALDEAEGQDIARGTLLKESVAARENAIALSNQQAQQQQQNARNAVDNVIANFKTQLGINDIEVDDEPEQKPAGQQVENTGKTKLSFADIDTSAMIEPDEIIEPFQAGQKVVEVIENKTNINELLNEGKPEQKAQKVTEQKPVELTLDERAATEKQLKDMQDTKELFNVYFHVGRGSPYENNTNQAEPIDVTNMHEKLQINSGQKEGPRQSTGWAGKLPDDNMAAVAEVMARVNYFWTDAPKDEKHPEGKALMITGIQSNGIMRGIDQEILDLNKKLNPPEKAVPVPSKQ